MKALTISQPFASLIANGEKFVENRTWPTNYRGPIAIHAGKGTQYMSRAEMQSEGMPCGQVVATARLLACMPLESMRGVSRTQTIQRTALTIGEVIDHEHTEGPWCWILTNVVKLDEPIDATGAQGLWDWQKPESVPSM